MTILFLAGLHLMIVLVAFVVLCLPQEISYHSDERHP